MIEFTPSNIAKKLSARTGLPVTGQLREFSDGTNGLVFHPEELDPIEGFTVTETPRWKSIEAIFFPDNYSGELLKAMGNSDLSGKYVFCILVNEIRNNSGSVSMSINGHVVDPGKMTSWTEDWRQMSISVRSVPIDTDEDLSLSENIEDLILDWGIRLMSMVIALLPLEEEQRSKLNPESRSKINHADIEKNLIASDHSCSICGKETSSVYPYEDNAGHMQLISLCEACMIAVRISKLNDDLLTGIKENWIKNRVPGKAIAIERPVPLIICEGKTDWKHIKAAIQKLKESGLFGNLNLDFYEFEDEIQMGDSELLRICETRCKVPDNRLSICIFDRDNREIMSRVSGNDGSFRDWGNKIYSFPIPVPAHRHESPDISIELYYQDNELKSLDNNGRRFYMSDEFNEISGKHLTESLNTTELNKIRRRGVIIDRKVFNEDNVNVALPKDQFANYVHNRADGFDDFNRIEFKKIFDVIQEIVNCVWFQ